jgi:succinyl-CoA synthetase beta subunit
MARLHEHQGKALVAKAGIAVPRGGPAASAERAAEIARQIGAPVVVKIQAWTTGRAAIGGVAFADRPEQAAEHARRMLGMKVGNFPVSEVLVEEKLVIARELFVSLSIDDRERGPVLLLSLSGGSGVEERSGQVKRLVCDVQRGPDEEEVARALAASDLPPAARGAVGDAIRAVFRVAREHEARSVEINPLAITAEGKVIAADCRVTIDDYAVYRHPDLGIDIARELDHPPTRLERIAYDIEQADHRGTFYFAQMNTQAAPGSRGLIGFHGAGGGGSMMSMDAITDLGGGEGFTIANFCDTIGDPSPAKVYRAARVILSQPGLVGYFGSGSGVANQEQYWSAYGLAKAFWELQMSIPAVIRLGGNTEDRAVEILEGACAELPGRVEGYKKTDPPAKIAARFAELVAASRAAPWALRQPRRPEFVGSPGKVSFAVKGGRVWIDAVAWKDHAAAIVTRSNGLLRDESGKPALTVKPEEFLSKDSDMIACEVECRRDGVEGLFVELDTPGLG